MPSALCTRAVHGLQSSVLPVSAIQSPARRSHKVCPGQRWGRGAQHSMHASTAAGGAVAHLLHERDGVDGPPLQDGFPLAHGQLGKGLHGRAHGH